MSSSFTYLCCVVMCFNECAACEHTSHLHSLASVFLQHVSSVTHIVNDVSNTFLICCVVVVAACVTDKLLLRVLRACAVLPARVTYVVTQEYAHQLDVGDAGSTETPAMNEQPCDGRAFTCREALLPSPLTELYLPQFSETKV